MSVENQFPFYYDAQIKKYLIQFMCIFSNMKVKTGKNASGVESYISPNIRFGSKDRVVAAIIGKNTQNALLKLPAMSAYVNGILMAPEMRKGIGQERRFSYLPRGAIFPDGIKVVRQVMPVPYKLSVELSLFTSNMEQHNQLIEQICSIFDPIVQIQKNDATFDWTRLTEVELVNIRYDTNYPSGPDRRIISSTLEFEFGIWLALPTEVKNDFIKDIMVRIGIIDNANQSNEDIIAEFDSEGIEYEKWFSLDDIKLPDS